MVEAISSLALYQEYPIRTHLAFDAFEASFAQSIVTIGAYRTGNVQRAGPARGHRALADDPLLIARAALLCPALFAGGRAGAAASCHAVSTLP